MKYIAGVDEVGRGSLAGPVMAAAVILDPKKPIRGLADSKTLTPKRRMTLCEEIKSRSLAWAIGRAEVKEIDEINILQATLLAMQRAINGLTIVPHHARIDGIHAPRLHCTTETIIKGDQTVAEISAASIIAKVLRDQEMIGMENVYPEYGFASHKGYGTAVHIAALKRWGPCEIHRRSFSIKSLE